MVPTQNSSVVANGLKNLTQLFKNQPNCKALLTQYLQPFQTLENVVWQIINGRIISNLLVMVAANQNTSTMIDTIGGLVGETRQGRADAFYLPAVMLRIRVNRSQGLAEDIIQVSNLLSPGCGYFEFPIAKWIVTAFDTAADVGSMVRLLGQANMGGVRGVLKCSTWPVAQTITLASRYGGAAPTVGLSSRYGSSTPSLFGALVSAEAVAQL